MRKSKANVIIVEPSTVVAQGLVAVIEDDERFAVVGIYSDIAHYENQPMSNKKAEITIVNPTLVDYVKSHPIKKLFPQTHLVAVIYSHLNRFLLAQFDETIDIYDEQAKILNKLLSVVEQDQTIAPTSEQGELSDREKEILVAVARGLTNKEIAQAHHISIHTVISHRKNISRKTGIRTVSGFVVYSLLNNLIEQSDIQ